MSDFPGLVQFKVAELMAPVQRRVTYIINVEKWVHKELVRRRLVLRSVAASLGWWAAFCERSAAAWIEADGSINPSIPYFTREHVGYYYDRSAGQLGYSTGIDWFVAVTWLRRLKALPPDQIVYVPVDEARTLLTLPGKLKFNDIPWADLGLPIQPPQPLCPLPTEEEFACNPSLTSTPNQSPAS